MIFYLTNKVNSEYIASKWKFMCLVNTVNIEGFSEYIGYLGIGCCRLPGTGLFQIYVMGY